MRTVFIVLCLLASGCSGGTDRRLGQLDQAATAALHRGNLPEALASADQGASLAGDRHRERATFELLAVEIHLLNRDADGADARLRRITDDLPADLIARRRGLEGQRAMVLGRMADAISLLEDAALLADAAGAKTVWLQANVLLGQALMRTGRWSDGEHVLRAALDRATDLGDLPQQAAMLLNLGMSRLVRGRFGEALPYFEQVLAFEGLEDHLVRAVAENNAGVCLARLGSFDRAVALQRGAIEAHRRRTVPLYLQQTLGELGNTYVLSGHPADALPYLQEAHAVALAADLTADAAIWAGNLAIVYADLARWDDAARFNDAAVDLKRRTGASTLVHNTLNRARIAAGRGHHDEALSAFTAALETPNVSPAISWEAHAGAAGVLRTTGRMQEALAHYDRALRIIDQTRSDLLQPEYRITFLSRLMRFHQSYVDLLVDLGRDGQALEVADASRARALADGHGAGRFAPVNTASLLRQTRDGERLIAYWLAPRRSFAWVIGDGRVQHIELPPAAAIAALVADFRQAIEAAVGDPFGGAASAADALSTAVLAPLVRYIPSGSRVTVVPDGALHTVNLESLPVGTPRRYWLEEVTLSVAPSLSLAGQVPLPRSTAPGAILLIGDPASVDVPPLRFAGAELEAIGRAYPGAAIEMYRGAAATPDAYRASRPERFPVIHFAAHATVMPASPLDSAIELSPGSSSHRLFARDVAALPLAADLVTISACRGAGARAYDGEGLVGFAWALLRAGAKRVVAGLWDVDDQSTALLMDKFYGRIAAGDSPATALRGAKLDVIATGGNFAKPYYWAPFQIFTATDGRSTATTTTR